MNSSIEYGLNEDGHAIVTLHLGSGPLTLTAAEASDALYLLKKVEIEMYRRESSGENSLTLEDPDDEA